MKILFVNNFRKRGGGEEFLRDLLPGLAAKGIEIGLICRPDTPLSKMFDGTDIRVFPVNRSGIHSITSVFTVAGIIREQQYDIVNIQRGHDIIQSWLGAVLSARKPKLMYTPQVPEFIQSKFLLRRMDAIATISRHIRDRIISFDPALSSMTSIVYYGIDLEKFQPEIIQKGWLRRRLGLPEDTLIIGTVGDFWKNQIEFLDSLKLLRESLGDIRYAVVGQTTDSEPVRIFKKKAAELNLTDAVLYPGRLPKEDMLNFYADIDLAVSTYRNEGFGIWILEAMAMGKPVIAFNAGGIRDSLEGSPCGILVDGGAREMAETIKKVLQDKDRFKSMSAAAPQWVTEKFSRERMINDYESYFRRLIAG